MEETPAILVTESLDEVTEQLDEAVEAAETAAESAAESAEAAEAIAEETEETEDEIIEGTEWNSEILSSTLNLIQMHQSTTDLQLANLQTSVNALMELTLKLSTDSNRSTPIAIVADPEPEVAEVAPETMQQPEPEYPASAVDLPEVETETLRQPERKNRLRRI